MRETSFRKRQRHLKRIALAFAAAAFTAPAAHAVPDAEGGRAPSGDAALGTPAPTVRAEPSFDWGAVGIGFGAGAALVLSAGGAAIILRGRPNLVAGLSR